MSKSPKKALIIGIDAYGNNNQDEEPCEKYLNPLPTCLKDALDLEAFLTNNGYSLFRDEIIIGSRLPTNGTAYLKMERAIKSFFSTAKHNEMLLFYFSGHGFRTDSGCYLASPDTNLCSSSGGFAVNELISLMKASLCRQIICIIDACYSGAAGVSAAEESNYAIDDYKNAWNRFQADGIHLLLSSRAYEPSEIDRKGENSVYTRYLLKGLSSSEAVNEYGCVTPGRLYEYVNDKVLKETQNKQKPDYEHKSDPNSITLVYHKRYARVHAENDTTVESVTSIPDLEKYYNAKIDRRVDVRQETIEKLKRWVENWSSFNAEDRKKILLITGLPGSGASWLAFKLVSDLSRKDYEILKIEGNRIHLYPVGIGNLLYPIFILDDRHIGIEGYAGGVPGESVYDIIQNIQQDFAGPIILSIRQDLWNRIMSGSMGGSSNKLSQDQEEKIIYRQEIDLDNEESIYVAEKVIRSFYERVDGREPPYKLILNTKIKNKILDKSRCNLAIIKIFFEKIRTKGSGYTVTMEDTESIVSDPIYYILDQLFDHYFDKDKKPEETAGILAGLYYIAKKGNMSIGSLHNLWQEYYRNGSRSLPKKVHIYLKNLFTVGRPNQWPPPLFDIDRYGSIISFHGSVDRTVRRLIENPKELASEIKRKRFDLDQEIGRKNREFIEENLVHIRDNISDIIAAVNLFSDQYSKDLKNWINTELEKWDKQKLSQEKEWSQISYKPKDAYFFLSMLKEYVEPGGKFDINRYHDFGDRFEAIYRTANIESDYENREISTTVNRLLYHLFEKSRAAEIVQQTDDESKAKAAAIIQNKGQLLYQLGAYDTDLDLLLEDYFPDKNPLEDPQLSGDDYSKLLLLRRVGLSLMTIGRLDDAGELYSKSYDIAKSRNIWLIDAAKILQLQAELYIHLGRLESSITAANDAILLYIEKLRSFKWLYDPAVESVTGEYCSTGNEMWGVQNIAMGPVQLIICSLAYQAWSLHLVGCYEFADVTFSEAEELARSINPNPGDRPKNSTYQNKPRPMQHLRDLWGIYHADHLIRKSDKKSVELARAITEENLEYAECNRLTEIVSQCHRVLGDIESWLGDNNHDSAKSTSAFEHSENAYNHYVQALDIAQKTSHHAVLIEALVSMGLWYVKKERYNEAINNYLQKAYERLPNSKNYKFYKIDIEIALAKAHLGRKERNDTETAHRYSEAALEGSILLHYRHGEMEANSLLSIK